MRLAVANSKGGAGKTVTALHIATRWAALGCRVLAIDTDPQSSLTHWLGIEDPQGSFANSIVNRSSLSGSIMPTGIDNLDLIPASIHLANAERDLVNQIAGELVLSRLIDEVAPDYDAVVIDCVGDNGVLAWGSIIAAKNVVIPVELSYLSVHGLSALQIAIDHLQSVIDDPISILGVVGCRTRPREIHSADCMLLLKEHFGNLLLDTTARDSVKMREAAGNHQSIFDYAPKSAIAADMAAIGDELLKRMKGMNHERKAAA